MEVAGRQSQLSAAPGAKPPKYKAQHFRGMNTSVSGRVCPRWILPAEAGGPAHCATGRNNPARLSHLLCSCLPFASTCAALKHRKGRAVSQPAGTGSPREIAGLQMTKIPAVGFQALPSPGERKNAVATPRGAQCIPTSRDGQGLGKQSAPVKHSPRTGHRVLPALYLSTGSKEKSKASTTTLRRVRSRQIADFKGYEINSAINKRMDNSFKAARSGWG